MLIIEELKKIILKLIKKNNFQNKKVAIRTNITRGISKRGLGFLKVSGCILFPKPAANNARVVR